MRRSPAVMSSRPAISRSSVDFPQPEGPTKTTNSPSLDLEVDALDDLRRAEGFADVPESDISHLTPRISPSPPPAVRPATILRWKTRTRTMSGTVTMTEAAMIVPQGSS